MKAWISPGWLFGILLATVAATSGCAHEGLDAPPTTSSSDAGRAAALAPVVPGKQGDSSLPPQTALSSWSHEIQELVQAGVEERVITTYITNSAGMFNLTADQIIYLKSAGVSPHVLNVMIQNDQNLFSSAGLMAAPAAPPASVIATFATPGALPVVANDEFRDQELAVPDDSYCAPEQPEGIGPVRAPYAVKLNDPIIMLRLPTFTVPYW